MLFLLSISLILLAAFYSSVLLYLRRGLFCLEPGSHPDQPFISVIVAARNEEQNIGSCLESLSLQHYPPDKHEIIVVNDRSTDDTANIVDKFVKTNSRFRLLNIIESNPYMSPKKWALTRGIQQAKGEIILTTDADCIVKPGWIASILRYFEKDVGLVAGFSPLDRYPSPSPFYRLIALESLALAGVAAGSFGKGFPLTCNGRNLAYRKPVYLQVGGFKSIARLISGDDDLLLHLVRKNTHWKLRYAIDQESFVSAKPPMNFKEFLHQRSRHASKGRHYPKHLKMGLIAAYLFNLSLLGALFFPILRPVFFLLLGAKSLFEFLLISKAATLFHHGKLLRFFPLAIPLHMIYVILLGFWGQVGIFKWKDDYTHSKISSTSRWDG